MPRLVCALATLLVLGPRAAHADVSLEVLAGDTPASVLIRHSREVRQAAGHAVVGTTRKRFAYRLLLRSPGVANARVHAGDRIVVDGHGRLSLWRGNKRVRFVGPPDLAQIVGPPAPAPAPAVVEAPAPVVPAPVVPAPVAAPPPALDIDADGRIARIRGQELEAGPGLTFFERAGMLHIVSLAGTPFDLAVAVPDAGPFVLPPSALVRRSGERLVLPAWLPADPLLLVARGELNVHDDHLHLAARLLHPAWQRLYAARLEDAPYDAMRRQAAAVLIVKLLDVHIDRAPGAFPASLAHALALVDRTWRAFDRGLPAREIAEMMDLDYEVARDGLSVDVGARTYVTAAPLRFEPCTGHFHVLGEDDDHRFAARVPLVAGKPPAFPDNPFYALSGNVVVPKPPMAAWMALIRTGQLEQRRGHYHLTTRWDDPALQALVALGLRARSLDAREAATGAVLQVLGTPLDPASEADLLQALGDTSRLATEAREAIGHRAVEKGWSLELAAAP